MTPQQEQYLNDTLKRATAFEEMTKSKGWEYITSYYQNKIQAFTSGILTTSTNIAEFERERSKIMGMRELITQVQEDLEALNDYRNKQREEDKGITTDI